MTDSFRSIINSVCLKIEKMRQDVSRGPCYIYRLYKSHKVCDGVQKTKLKILLE